MAEEDLSGLLNINFNSDSEPEEATDPKTSSTTATTTNGNSRADRNALSEADFQTLKQSYQAKVENGEIHKSIILPLSQAATISKPEAQEILHAAEELYFFRRYAEGADFVRRVIGGDDDESGSACPLDEETKALLRYYGERCKQRISLA